MPSSPNNSDDKSQAQTYNSHNSPTNPTDRIRSLANQMASPVLATSFPADAVPQAPEDPLFGLMAAYRADTSPDKVDLVGRHSPAPRVYDMTSSMPVLKLSS